MCMFIASFFFTMKLQIEKKGVERIKPYITVFMCVFLCERESHPYSLVLKITILYFELF